ncbi:MAG: YdbL family protein [Candidatus Omnitrophota bacterium]
MKGFKVLLLMALVFSIGCATVRVKAPSEPIKIDISMRLDVYQHVQKDIDAIENIVSGSGGDEMKGEDHSFLGFFVSTAYAQGLSSDIEKAALRRRARHSELASFQASGVIGEDNAGLVTVRGAGGLSAQNLVSAENKDRMIIYKGVASKNGTSVHSVQKVYAKRLQKDAPKGTPVQSDSGGWSIK